MTDVEPGGLDVQVVSDPGGQRAVARPLTEPVGPVCYTELWQEDTVIGQFATCRLVSRIRAHTAAALVPEPREPGGEGSARFSVTDSTETEDSGASSQKSSVLTQKMLNPLPAPEKYRKRRMPGGRFQAPAEEACLSSLEGSLSVSRRSGSEAWGQAASSLSATPGPEQPRPPSASEVSRAEGARRAPRVDAALTCTSP